MLPGFPGTVLGRCSAHARVYLAWGATGRRPNPAMEQLLTDVDDGLVLLVLIARISRWARSEALGMEWFDRCAAKGVPVLSAAEPWTWWSRSRFQAALVTAEQDWRALTRRLKRGRERSSRRAGPTPFGLHPSGVDQWKAVLVQEAHQLFGSWKATCAYLNDRADVRPPRGGHWYPGLVRRICTSARYQLLDGLVGPARGDLDQEGGH